MHNAMQCTHIPYDKMKWNILWLIISCLNRNNQLPPSNKIFWALLNGNAKRRQFWIQVKQQCWECTTTRCNDQIVLMIACTFLRHIHHPVATICYACISWHWPRIFFKCNVTFTDSFTIAEMCDFFPCTHTLA